MPKRSDVPTIALFAFFVALTAAPVISWIGVDGVWTRTAVTVGVVVVAVGVLLVSGRKR